MTSSGHYASPGPAPYQASCDTLAGMEARLETLAAIDMHVHLEVSSSGRDALGPALRAGANRYFRREAPLPSADEIAAYYRVAGHGCRPVRGRRGADHGRRAGSERRGARGCAGQPGRPDPVRERRSRPRAPPPLSEARRLIGAGARGFKLHPPLQAFAANDRLVYPLYEVIEAAGLPVIVHTGQSGIGAGQPGGGGIRLRYGNPMDLDDVAADFPDLPIVLAHPSFPWQDEALAVALHKPNVFIDLSGWLPRYFPPQLVRYAGTLLADKVMFGSDYPLISPDRWLADFAALEIREDARAGILRGNAARLLGLGATRDAY